MHEPSTTATWAIPSADIVAGPSITEIEPAFLTLEDTARLAEILEADPANVPSFSVVSDFPMSGLSAPFAGGSDFFSPQDFALTLHRGTDTFGPYPNTTDLRIERGDPPAGVGFPVNEQVGDLPGEGTRLRFDVPEQEFLDNFLAGEQFRVQLENRLPRPFTLSELSQDTGVIRKGEP